MPSSCWTSVNQSMVDVLINNPYFVYGRMYRLNVSYEPIILVSKTQVSLNYQLILCIFLEMSGSKQTYCKMTNTKVGIASYYEYSST